MLRIIHILLYYNLLYLGHCVVINTLRTGDADLRF